MASIVGAVDAASSLLLKNANIDSIDAEGNTSLHLAAWHNKPLVVALLLSRGARRDIRNNLGEIATDMANEDTAPLLPKEVSKESVPRVSVASRK